MPRKKKKTQKEKSKELLDNRTEEQKKATADFLNSIFETPEVHKVELDETGKPKKIGRPKKITNATVQKLRNYFVAGMSVQKACYYCGISVRSFYNFVKDNPEFMHEKTLLEDAWIDKAKINIVADVMNGDVKTSQWSLERLDKKNFSTKVGVEHSGEIKNYTFTSNLED